MKPTLPKSRSYQCFHNTTLSAPKKRPFPILKPKTRRIYKKIKFESSKPKENQKMDHKRSSQAKDKVEDQMNPDLNKRRHIKRKIFWEWRKQRSVRLIYLPPLTRYWLEHILIVFMIISTSYLAFCSLTLLYFHTYRYTHSTQGIGVESRGQLRDDGVTDLHYILALSGKIERWDYTPTFLGYGYRGCQTGIMW